ncbi:CHAT domain-containing protein [Roseofilum sp. BLCC_M91]|uniref:CHAT domain-containing protein n=1 Tax=Roseofilum halophilum BLCC-M91 TaxID=3022259 RepID=A0ABT7BKV1_9CYAN|nr:CHAT domain-containing tetratricopeptide repeat protein [Roseofilum halophilum]MDJ1179690.1 CHAT domain-containing protein [Roseofilum halophilum BLCC-M91]
MERIPAYLNLIQELLTCPRGEEAQRLNDNRELLDRDFLLTCGQIAQQMQEEGRENEARFLLDLVQQLAQALDLEGGEGGANVTEQEYLSFLMQVLQATAESNGDAAVVHPLLQQNLEKLDLNLAQILKAWATERLETATSSEREFIANVLYYFNLIVSSFRYGSRANNIEIAIACLEIFLQVFTRQDAPEYWAIAQNSLGNKYSDRLRGERAQNLERAIACYEAALEVRTRSAFPQNHVETLFNLGLAYRDASQPQQAYDSFAAAIDTLESIRSAIIIGGEADKQKLAEEWQKLYRNMIEVCLDLDNPSAALEYAERSKARNLVDLIAATRLKPETLPQEVWERYNQLYQQWWQLQQQTNGSSPQASSPDDSRSLQVSVSPSAVPSPSLTQLRQQLDDFIATEITPHDPKFRFGQSVQPIRYREIQALVPAHTALIEWYFTSQGIHAFIVTPEAQQPTLFSTDSSAVDALEQLKDEYLTDYLHRDNHWRQTLPTYLHRLAHLLQLPNLLSHIPPDCQHLILVPYRYLHLFPLHALPIPSPVGEGAGEKDTPSPVGEGAGGEGIPSPVGEGAGGEGILSDQFPQGIRYIPSSQILQLSLSETLPQPTDKSLFAIQNPTRDLTFAQIEVEAIQSAFNPATVLPGKAAHKTAFTQATPQFKTLQFAHFSCHGFFNFSNPRHSGLILANAQLPATPTPEKGLAVIRSRRGNFNVAECLTVPEIFNLRLPQCRLVTLSACETGITDIATTSDEYISILAGFFFAGARNVLGTLWAVNDLSTAIFMIRFYETLLTQPQPPVALSLKHTQEWMRSLTCADLVNWISTCSLMPEAHKPSIQQRFSLGFKPHYQPYQSPYHWAAFYAVGQ